MRFVNASILSDSRFFCCRGKLRFFSEVKGQLIALIWVRGFFKLKKKKNNL